MYSKAIVMFSIFIVPLIVLLTIDLPTWAQVLMTIIIGIGMAGVGMNIMHDANHGSYTEKKATNRIMGYLFNFLRAYHVNWKIQHNVLHHTFTNVEGFDEDIDAPVKFLRFSPHTEWRPVHKYQY